MLPLNPRTLNVTLYDASIERAIGTTMFFKDTKITNFWQYCTTYLNALLVQLERDCITTPEYWSQTIAVDSLGYSALDVLMTEDRKIKLLESGFKATEVFLAAF
jgi:hypothetical protein